MSNAERSAVIDFGIRHSAFGIDNGALSPGADPVQVLGVVEYLPREARFRGLGYLFGFPDYAVDFFVKATVPGAETGKGKERDFYAVPVYP